MTNSIYSINGPVVTVHDATKFAMLRNGTCWQITPCLAKLFQFQKQKTTIQVYESTTGLQSRRPCIWYR